MFNKKKKIIEPKTPNVTYYLHIVPNVQDNRIRPYRMKLDSPNIEVKDGYLNCMNYLGKVKIPLSAMKSYRLECEH